MVGIEFPIKNTANDLFIIKLRENRNDVLTLSPLYYQEIRDHRLFNMLPKHCFDSVIQTAGILFLKKNELLYECGFKARQFFLIHSGQMALFQMSSEGNEKIISLYDSGDIFAEDSMFTDEKRYSTCARACSDTALFYFDAQNFKQQMNESYQLCLSMMEDMSSRIQQQTQEIVELSIYDAQYRLVSYLLKKGCKAGLESCQPVIVLSTTKTLLASRLSITPETFSRILSKLKKQGLISIDESEITLNEPEQLKQLIGYNECSGAVKKQFAFA